MFAHPLGRRMEGYRYHTESWLGALRSSCPRASCSTFPKAERSSREGTEWQEEMTSFIPLVVCPEFALHAFARPVTTAITFRMLPFPNILISSFIRALHTPPFSPGLLPLVPSVAILVRHTRSNKIDGLHCTFLTRPTKIIFIAASLFHRVLLIIIPKVPRSFLFLSSEVSLLDDSNG